jgi:hypothetical protein
MTETSTVSNAGLFVRDETHAAVPLTGVSIEAEVNGLCARVSVGHRYVNRESTPIEAVYVFPLDEGAAVCGFEAVVDGTLVVGEVQEREKAFETYDDAMADGHGAFLLDEERPDVFQASVGNLLPGKEVLLRLTYVTELSIDGGCARFTIPTTISPRYAPAADHTGVGRSDAQTLNPPVAWSVPYGLNLSMRIAMPGKISTLESPSHPISLTLNEHEATVTLAREQAALDRDFVLSIGAAGMDSPQAVIERAEDGTEAVAVSFVPTFSETASPAEIVFVVDRSGSMEGTSIEEVRNALQLCLRSMISGCRFNIVGFGATYESLFPETRAYDQSSLDAASRHVRELRANLGGTEILPALEFTLSQPRHAELSRQVVILTDGQVTNTDAVLALVAKHAAEARVFTFGIGAGASQHLVRGLARAGGGAAEFIYPGERIEPKVVRQFGRLLSPALHDVKVEWIGEPVTSMPMKVPPVFAGSRLLVYGFPKRVRPAAVRLSATSPSGHLAFEVPFADVRVTAGKSVTTLAARARIRELEESGEWLATRGSRQTERKHGSVTREIIELSIRYGLISRETSFVAVERREAPVQGDIQLRRVPIALTSGWGGIEHRMSLGSSYVGSLPAPAAAMPRGMRTLSLGSSGQDLRRFDGRLADTMGEAEFRQMPSSWRMREPIAPPGMHALVALQQADGYWELTVDLARVLDRTLSDIEAALAGGSGSPSDLRRAWATALAITWLRVYAPAAEEEWSLLSLKARKWLDDANAVAPGGWTWLDAARRFLVA